MKYRDVIKMIEADGWRHIRTTGSHMHFAHPRKLGLVTVAGGGKLSKGVPIKTLASILRQAGLR